MTIPRIYSPSALEEGKPCRLESDQVKYLKHVLRLPPGAPVIVFDGRGAEFAAHIKSFTPRFVEVELKKKIETSERKIKITLAQALPKAHKMDMIVRSAAELGADEIIPFVAGRSVARISEEKSSEKVARWQKIAREAARCCRDPQIANVRPVASFDAVVASEESGFVLKMIFWEEEEQKTIKDLLTNHSRLAVKNFFIIVGPEGGFTREEIAKAQKAGFTSVSLGRQILKAESAAAAIITIIQYEKGIFSRASKR